MPRSPFTWRCDGHGRWVKVLQLQFVANESSAAAVRQLEAELAKIRLAKKEALENDDDDAVLRLIADSKTIKARLSNLRKASGIQGAVVAAQPSADSSKFGANPAPALSSVSSTPVDQSTPRQQQDAGGGSRLTTARSKGSDAQEAERSSAGDVSGGSQQSIRPDEGKPVATQRVMSDGTLVTVEEREDGSESITYPDGSKSTRYVMPDGAIVEELENGSVRQTNPDGSTIVQTSNGTIIQTSAEGTVTTQSTRIDGPNAVILTTELPDGTKIDTFDDGHVVQQNPDGTKLEMLSDGLTIVQSNPNGKVITTRADGSKTQLDPDGTTFEIHVDGTTVQTTPGQGVATTFPDGRQSDLLPSGIRVDTEVDGTKIQVNVDGSIFTSFPDGSKKLQSPDGTVRMVSANGEETIISPKDS